MDFDSIPPGVDFREQIQQTIERSDVVVAVIGHQWFGERSDGSRRIDDANDFVRLEIEYALGRKIPIIPLLVNNRSMPAPEELPEAIGPLAFRNGVPLDSGRDFHNHVDRIVSGIGAALERSGKSRPDNLRDRRDQTATKGTLKSSHLAGNEMTSSFRNKIWVLIALAVLIVLAFLFARNASVSEQRRSSSESLTLAVTPAPTQAMLSASAVPATPSPAATASPAGSAETAESPVTMAAASVPQLSIDGSSSADASRRSEQALIVITLSADRYGHSVRTAFDSSTPTIYAMLKTVGLKRGDQLHADWIAQFARSGVPKGTVVNENEMKIFHDIDGDDYVAFRQPSPGWVPGKYRLEIYLRGKQMAHSDFTILKP